MTIDHEKTEAFKRDFLAFAEANKEGLGFLGYQAERLVTLTRTGAFPVADMVTLIEGSGEDMHGIQAVESLSDPKLAFDAGKLVKRFDIPGGKETFMAELEAMARTKAAAAVLHEQHAQVMHEIRAQAHLDRMVEIGSPFG